ncbi:hypothetical protein [Pseudanabaena galeata]|uniref:hypothetical protein n=1 Tax=Pseudanabaena galeata TaxID=1112103 RepID=UPI0024792679|nr:hypothetical protein [Pseudanabaena galeata]WGS71116.1 hypothetical protein OA858_15480 [Pseudanabaena galeata CCNP1313]
MQWDLGKIWGDGWVFYVPTIAIFLGGCCWEWFKSYQPKKKEFDVLEDNLKILKDNKNEGISFKDHEKWFKEHLLSEKADPNDHKFRLQQYPREIVVIPRTSLRFLPPILTALGVLGTFYGMSVGLMGVKIDAGNVEKSLNSAITLIEGMKTAFFTSLLGLGTSTILSAILAYTDKLRRYKCYNLRNQLDKIAVLETPERAMSRLNFDSTAEAAKQLSGLASQFNAEAIGAAVGKAIAEKFDDIVELRLAPTFTQIADSQLRLEKLTNDQREVLANLIGNMRTELIVPVTERLDQSSSLLNRSAEVLESASNAIQVLNEDLAGIALRLAEASVTLEGFQRQTLVQLMQFANSLQDTLTQFQTATRDVLVDTATEIREGTNAILTQAQMTFQEQNDILRTVGQETSGLMISARKSLESSLTNIDTRLQQMSDTTQQQLETFQVAYQRNLQEFFDRQNNLLEESLGKQRDGLAGVVNNLNVVFQEEYQRRNEISEDLSLKVKEIQNATTSVSQLVDSMEVSYPIKMSQLESISRIVGSQLEQLEISNNKLHDGYQVSMESLGKMLQEMIDGEQNFFKKADSSMAKVSSGLLEAANVLVEVNREARGK